MKKGLKNRNKKKGSANKNKKNDIKSDIYKDSNCDEIEDQLNLSSNKRDANQIFAEYEEKLSDVSNSDISNKNTNENTDEKNFISEKKKANNSFAKNALHEEKYNNSEEKTDIPLILSLEGLAPIIQNMENRDEIIDNNCSGIESNGHNYLNYKTERRNFELNSNIKENLELNTTPIKFIVKNFFNEPLLVRDDSTQQFNECFHIFNQFSSPPNSLESLEIDEKKLYYNINTFNNLYVYNSEEYEKGNYINKNIIEPPFLSLREIFPYIKDIISKENKIFNGENDFKNCIGENYNNIYNILKNNGTNKLKSGSRPLQMAKKYKAFILEQMIKSTNKLFSENINYKKFKLKKINKHAITEEVNSGFILNMFPREMFSLLSNDLTKEEKKKHNYDIIKTIIDDYEIKQEETSIIKHLFLTYEDCLNIILGLKKYKENVFQHFLKDLIEKVYKKLKKGDELSKKDYITGFILLGYNLKKFYCKTNKRKARKKKFKK